MQLLLKITAVAQIVNALQKDTADVFQKRAAHKIVDVMKNVDVAQNVNVEINVNAAIIAIVTSKLDANSTFPHDLLIL
ncbi:MAG TPA: hypothetical protein VLG44_07055 [Chlamydiales bacterium]|nr:hypothetical protein [Chlamydiales bacterium]